MKVQALRNLVLEYQEKGLPVIKRTYIKKKLGLQDYRIVAREYDSFLKGDILDQQPEQFVLLSDNAFINVRLKRNFDRIILLSKLKKENILDTLSGAKKLAKLPVNKEVYYNKKTAGNVFIKQVSNSGNYIITSKNGDEIGIFSVAAADGENTIGDFIIYEKYRKTDVVKEAMLAMNDFFQKSQYEYLNCAVELDKPFLVRMYEKFGFEIKSIYSLNIKDTKHTLFELQKNGLHMK